MRLFLAASLTAVAVRRVRIEGPNMEPIELELTADLIGARSATDSRWVFSPWRGAQTATRQVPEITTPTLTVTGEATVVIGEDERTERVAGSMSASIRIDVRTPSIFPDLHGL